jgi:hypothetical protein
VLALVALLLALGHPPTASVVTASGSVPLSITSWCWDNRCGAPLATSNRRAVVHRGSTVHLLVKDDALESNVSVSGDAARVKTNGREITWTATHSGGLTAYVRYRHGWVIYTGRLAVA